MASMAVCLKRYTHLLKVILWKHCQIRCRSIDVLYSLKQRELIKEIFPDDINIKTSSMPCAYAGFDATSNSLHIGNLLILITLIHWQRAGNQSIVVIGDATAKVGDPSGHKTERNILQDQIIMSNASDIEESVHRIFFNHEAFLWSRKHEKKKALQPVKILKNSSWHNIISGVDLVCHCRPLRLGEMLSRTSVKTRMESGEGMSAAELMYQFFQSYDWLHLMRNHNCQFQFGGNDQFGNIMSGYQLISGGYSQNVYGALLPLIESETGDKYGKSSGNAVCLNKERSSPFELYQFFIRSADADVEKYLKLFTFLSLDEIENIIQKHMKDTSSRYGQKKIAEEVVLLVHGDDGLESAKRATKAFYESDIESLTKMSTEELQQILPPDVVAYLPFEHGLSLLDMTLKAHCFINEDDAVRIIKEGGVRMNFEKVTTPSIVITPGIHVLPNGTTLIRIGKKTYYLIIWT